jgi:hypothetical protein
VQELDRAAGRVKKGMVRQRLAAAAPGCGGTCCGGTLLRWHLLSLPWPRCCGSVAALL